LKVVLALGEQLRAGSTRDAEAQPFSGLNRIYKFLPAGDQVNDWVNAPIKTRTTVPFGDSRRY